MITELTKEQRARFPEFVEKWTKIGLSTEPINRAEVESALKALYATANKKPAKPIWCHSPMEAVLIIALLRANVRDNVSANVRDNVLANVRANVSANVRDNVLANVLDNVLDNVSANVLDNVLDNVSDNVSDNVRDNVRDNVLANVRANVSANVRDNVLANVLDNVSANVLDNVLDNVSDNVSDNVRDNVRANVRDVLQYWYYEFGQFAAYWLSYYDFCASQFGIDKSPLDANERLCKSAGWSFLFWKWAFISEKPLCIHRNGRNQLHKDLAPALEYSDGVALYMLNGVRMKKCQVLTPAEQISPQEVLSETNADVRRELIRKVGVERMLAKLPYKIIGKRGNYELLSVELSPEVRDARYLKMLNPSIGTFHVEGVAPECDTVEKSLNWRNQHRFTDAEILT